MTDRVIDFLALIYPFVGWTLTLIGIGIFLSVLIGAAAFGSGLLVYFASLAGALAAIGQGIQMIAEDVDG